MSNQQRDPADAFDIPMDPDHLVPKKVSDRSDTFSPDDELTIEPPEFDPTAPLPGEDAVKQDGRGQVVFRLPTTEPGAPRKIPDFAKGKIPKDLVFPRGIDAWFIEIPAHLTHARHKGNRVCILWELTEGDEKLAYGRSMQDPSRAVGELAKQMIRAFDGHKTDWSGTGLGNVDQFWREIGPKGRNLLTMLHARINVMQAEDLKDFFENRIVPVHTG
jgi:hypothetical protein